VSETGGSDGRCPVVATPVAEVEVPASLAGKEERRIEPWRQSLKCLQHAFT
jgi:hypothetical protein